MKMITNILGVAYNFSENVTKMVNNPFGITFNINKLVFILLILLAIYKKYCTTYLYFVTKNIIKLHFDWLP